LRLIAISALVVENSITSTENILLVETIPPNSSFIKSVQLNGGVNVPGQDDRYILGDVCDIKG